MFPMCISHILQNTGFQRYIWGYDIFEFMNKTDDLTVFITYQLGWTQNPK